MNIQLYHSQQIIIFLTYISVEFSDFNDTSDEHNLKSTTMKIIGLFNNRQLQIIDENFIFVFTT